MQILQFRRSIRREYAMLTREKIVLKLLSCFPEPLDKISLVKFVFLLRHQTMFKAMHSFYDFVPYKFGPFSFTLYRDLERLRDKNLVVLKDTAVALSQLGKSLLPQHTESLSSAASAAIAEVVSEFKDYDTNTLMKHVYRSHPWFTVNSVDISSRLMSRTQLDQSNRLIYTVGYEGKSIDAFMNDLLKEDIRVLIDVRANALSRKYGFSKVRLSSICQNLEIEYLHKRCLGISSKERHHLGNRQSYRILFERYGKRINTDDRDSVRLVSEVMEKTPSAMMCFEKDNQSCHRTSLANAVSSLNGLEINHL